MVPLLFLLIGYYVFVDDKQAHRDGYVQQIRNRVSHTGEKEMDISIIILNWNNPLETIDCIRNLLKVESRYDLGLIIVDNGSTDDSFPLLEKFVSNNSSFLNKKFDNLKLIQNPSNYGFSKGVNRAINFVLNKFSPDFIMLLNNDAFPEKKAIDKMMVPLAQSSKIMGAGAVLFDDPLFSQIQTMGGCINMRTGRRKNLIVEGANLDGIIEVDYFPAACIIYRSQVFREVGYFDQTFFMYSEDVDFGIRVRKVGYKIVCVLNAKCYHKLAASSGGANNPLLQYHITKNSYNLMRKHSSILTLTIFVFYNIPIFVHRLITSMKRDRTRTIALVRGVVDGLKSYSYGGRF
ncbi:MAG: glycosyltransferase family 2 protein [Candidatus Heimdallarchaeota archaeon]|nr:glycosyltransferase family 2 protein [Candidatus Heimdallarchaeota archaeon]